MIWYMMAYLILISLFQLNHLVYKNALPQFTVVKVKKFVCSPKESPGMRVTMLVDLEVLQRGEMVGKRIGNPATIGLDGKVSL